MMYLEAQATREAEWLDRGFEGASAETGTGGQDASAEAHAGSIDEAAAPPTDTNPGTTGPSRDQQRVVVVGRGGFPTPRPRRTVYMDGVFDLFHAGHLEAIQQCAALGDRVIIGVTGDSDAASYKRAPIM